MTKVATRPKIDSPDGLIDEMTARQIELDYLMRLKDYGWTVEDRPMSIPEMQAKLRYEELANSRDPDIIRWRSMALNLIEHFYGRQFHRQIEHHAQRHIE